MLRIDTVLPSVSRGQPGGGGKRLLLAVVVVGAVSIAGSWLWVRALERHLLREQVQDEAWRWAEVLRGQVPNLEALLGGEFLRAEDRRVLDFAIRAGRIVRYKLFSADGTVVEASRNADLGKVNGKPYFRQRVMHGEGYTTLVDKSSDTRFEGGVIGEAYAPIMIADGELDAQRFLGAIEVYVDMTGPAAQLRGEADKALGALLALVVVIVAVVGAFVRHDLHSRKVIERALRSDRASLSRAQRIARLGSWTLAGGELRCSEEAMRILALEGSGPLPGAAIVARVHPEDRARVEAACQGALAGTGRDLEHRLLLPGGEERHVHLRIEAEGDERGPRLEGTIHDITERVLAEREREHLRDRLRQAERLEVLGSLAGGIAHEINTPAQYVGDNLRFLGHCFEELSPLLDALETGLGRLAAAGLDREQVRALAAAMEAADLDYQRSEIPAAVAQSLDGIERIREIVAAVAEFARAPGGEVEPIDLNEAVRSAVTVAHPHWQPLARVELDLDDSLPEIPCQRAEIHQTLLELIRNAAWAVGAAGRDRPGRIEISTRVHGGEVEVRVCDDGVGIAPEAIGRIFDPFYTTKAPGEGTGQGLATCYAVVVQRHRGGLEVDSRPAAGATFRMRLPLHRPGEAANDPAAALAASA